MNSEFSPDDPPVDIQRLEEFSNNDPDTLKQLITLYLAQTSEQLEKLRLAIAANNASEVNRIAHSCVGSGSTCGMNHIISPLRALERQGRTGDLSGASLMWDEAAAALDRLRLHFEPYLK